MRLKIEDLVLERGGRIVIDGLTAEAAAGRALVLTGRNGAGKTTLLRALAGFLEPRAGNVRLTGSPLDGPDAPPIGEVSHYVGHQDALKAALTVGENAHFWTTYLGGPETGIAPALERVGLGGLAGVPARYLSAGQRRRLALARLLLARRPLWLMDEPTSSLDTAGQALFAALATAHLEAGGLLVAATHLPLGLTRFDELALDGGRAAA